jgi:hypothetical protein
MWGNVTLKKLIAIVLVLGLTQLAPVNAQYPEWKYSGSVFVLTTPEGANLPAEAVVENFPLLVRLNKDFFNFSHALPNGDDLRFSTPTGAPLAHQIEEWDASKGVASIWVRIPKITGKSRQEIRLHWGKADAKPESDGKAVFNKSNGYLSVLHMARQPRDEAGTVAPNDTGTTPVAGVIGEARHFPGQKGVFCGDKITGYPVGSGSHSSEAWVRVEKPNSTIMAWGNEQGQGKVVMQYRSPAHVRMDCYFSGGNVASQSAPAAGEWFHVAHTYEKGESRVYVNGMLAGNNKNANPPLNIRTPARFWIGGWYHNYDFIGDLDEVRVSDVVRSPEWVRLQYENQKLHQTLVGPVVQPGNEFAIAETEAGIPEGKSAVFQAKAGGAQKLYWSEVRDGKEFVVATDRFAYRFDAGRVMGNQTVTLRLKAVYPTETKIRDIRITVREEIPEPDFTLKVPASWDGRQPLEIAPQILNADAMRAKAADRLNYSWDVGDIGTVREIAPGKLILRRSLNSGLMTIRATIDNGGAPVTKSATISVKEPATDAWVERVPGSDEKPEDGQFYPRDDRNEGTLYCNGTLPGKAEAVFLRVFAGDKPFSEISGKPGADGSYSLSAKLNPGLVQYRIEFGSKSGGVETVLHKAANLLCGDAYIIIGQSNAVATDFGKEDPAFRSEWIRTFGTMSGNAKEFTGWGDAVHRSREGGKLQVGYWGMELGKRIVESHKMPVFLINGAVGGTRVDQHQRNEADPEDLTTIYGRLLWRLRRAKLAHGVRGIIWHQGENDQGADGPTGGYGWETYRKYFIDLAAAWKRDYPNARRLYAFQIWPKACAMGVNGSDNRLREVQRNLPTAFSHLSVMSTLGIDPPGGCHFPAAGYAEFARMIYPLLARDHYGKTPSDPITPPNLVRASLEGDGGDRVVLEFDQPVKWDNALAGQFYLDGKKGLVVSGAVAGKVLTLKVAAGGGFKNITYLDSAAWSQKTLLVGQNGIAALTFCDVPLLPRKP